MKKPQSATPAIKNLQNRLSFKGFDLDRLSLPLAFAIPCLGFLCIMLFGGYEPFGDSRSMLYSDMYHQYYPFFVAFRKNLLSGESLLYSWDVGMGMDYLGLISYYLGSPLNFLSILLPESWTLEYFSLLVPIKLGFAGLFFAIFLKKLFGKSDLSIAFFGGFYATCAWALGYQWNVMWLDSFALLPLVALGTVCLLRDKKFMLYTISLFFAVCINYYVGFFVCIFVFLLFICYEICRFSGIKRLVLDLGRIALFSAIAIGMTAFLELPALAALQRTQSSVNVFPEKLAFNIADEVSWKGLLDAMGQVAGRMGGGLEHTFKEGLPNLYCGIGTMVLAFLYLTAKDIRIRDKICAVALLLLFMLSFIIRQLDYVWHGFHFPNQIPYRFSFLYSFVMLYMAYHAWTLRSNFQLWQYIVAGVLSAGIILNSDSMKSTVYPLYNLGFIALYVGIGIFVCVEKLLYSKPPRCNLPPKILESHQKCRNQWIFGITCTVMGLELVLNLISFGTRFPYTSVTNYPSKTTYAETIFNYMDQREKDTPFYRAEVTHSQTLNDGALNGYNGISTFTSSANVRVTKFMQALGYSAKDTYNRYCFEEASPVANLFLNLKYMVERDGDVEENATFDEIHSYGDVYLLENNAYLPLGFLADPELADVDLYADGTRFKVQNELLKQSTGIQENVWSILGSDCINIQGSPSATIIRKVLGWTKYSTTNAATIRYTFTIKEDGFLCLDMHLPKRNNFTIFKDNVELYKEKPTLPQMYSVCEVKAGESVYIDIICGSNESTAINVDAAIMSHDVFRQAYDVLNASTLEVTSFSNTKIDGTIHCNRDGLMYTSIPYDGNWEATVDGKPVEIVAIADAMCGLYLSEGSHRVIFTYKNEAFQLGLVISLVSALILAAAYFIAYRGVLKKIKFFNRVSGSPRELPFDSPEPPQA